MHPRHSIVVLIAILASVTVGCVAQPSADAPQTTPTATSPALTPRPSPTPSPTPTRVVSLGGCEDLIDIGRLHQLVQPDIEPLDVTSRAVALPGPSARAALDSATTSLHCSWGLPMSDGLFDVVVAELPEPVSEALVRSLETAEGYRDVSADGMRIFGSTFDEGYTVNLAYVFSDGLWTIAEGTMLTPESAVAVASEVTQNVLAANR